MARITLPSGTAAELAGAPSDAGLPAFGLVVVPDRVDATCPRTQQCRAMRRERPKAVTYVMHSFMDARYVRPAWELLQRGETSEDPKILEAQERLQACSYAMAHPESGTLVPACAQHSVLDPLENLRLQELLPARATAQPAPVP